MTGKILKINGSKDVMAMFGESGVFYRGRLQDIMVVEIGLDKEIPIEVRKGLVGLVVPTVFTKEGIEKETGVSFPIPANSRLAYVPDVADILRAVGRTAEAARLAEDFPGPLDMYVFEEGTYVPA